MNYRLIIIILMLILGTGFISCSKKKPQKQNTLRINIGANPNSLDPRKARDLVSINLTKLLFEGLVRLNESNLVEKALAEDIIMSSDKKKYTFVLKKTFWSNGDILTSDDFIYSWTKVLTSDFPSPYASLLYVVKGGEEAKKSIGDSQDIKLKKVSDFCFEVELISPIPYFLHLLSHPVFFPVHKNVDTTNSSWSRSSATYICNGPFRLSSWKLSDEIVLKKNDKYWDCDEVKLNCIQMKMVSPEVELSLYEKNELDWAGSPFSILPTDSLLSLKKRKDYHVQPYLGTAFLRINTKKWDEILKDKGLSLRKSLASSINRKDLIDHVLKGDQFVATSLTPKVFNLHKTVLFEDGHIDLSKKLINQYDNIPEICITYVSNERNYLVAQTLQRMWSDSLNIKVRLEPLEGQVFYDRLGKGDYMVALGSFIADFYDPINFLEVFKLKYNGMNNTFWENERYISLLENSNFSNNRENLFKEAESILLDEMPIIPIYHLTMNYLKAEKIKGIMLPPTGHIDFKKTYFEEN